MVIYYFLFHKDKFVSFTPDYCNIFSSIKNKDRERERNYRIQITDTNFTLKRIISDMPKSGVIGMLKYCKRCCKILCL